MFLVSPPYIDGCSFKGLTFLIIFPVLNSFYGLNGLTVLNIFNC
jgi:hypothetical protein